MNDDDGYNYDKFKELAKYEKIGFPDSYSKDSEELIFKDIIARKP